MTKRDDISSTEKLLDAIRNKSGETDIEEERIEIPSSAGPSEGQPNFDEEVIEVKVFNQDRPPANPPQVKVGISSTKTHSIPKVVVKEFTKPVIPRAGSKASTVVGVKINHDDICMVMANRVSATNRELMKYKKVPFPEGIAQDSRDFQGFLRSNLTEFCGSYANCEIWTSVPAESLENRVFTIPKVPEKKIANAAYWTFRKEVPFEEGKMIFDFEVLGETVEDNAKKINISAYVVDKYIVNEIKKLFLDIKFPLSGISVAPFAFQNFFRLKWVEPDTEKICTVNIGLEHSRIDIFSNGDLVMSRNVKTGIDSMIGAIREEADGVIRFDGVEETEEEDLTPVLEIETFEGVEPPPEYDSIDADIEEEPVRGKGNSLFPGSSLDIILGSDYNAARKVFLDITNKNDALTLSVKEQKIDDHIFEMINPVVERLVRQIERTFEYYSRTYKTGSPTKVIFSGELSTYKRLTEYIGSQLGLVTGIIDPFASSLQLTHTVTPPKSVHEREAFSVAYGLALSDISLTPNLIYTFMQKKVQKRVKLVNTGLFAAFFLMVLVCLGVTFNLAQARAEKKSEIQQIKTSLSRFVPLVDQSLLQNLYQELEKKKGIMKKYAVNCLGTAVISELTNKTPDSIKLTKVEAELFTPSEKAGEKESSQNKGKNKLLTIEGYVTDTPMALESTLAGYLVDINSSPIFGKVTIRKKNIVVLEEEEVLTFQAVVEMI